MNKVMMIGRATKEPDLKYTPSGTAVASFTLAVDRWKRDEGADFFDCVAFGKPAETLAEHVDKGNKLGIVGRLQNDSWEDRDGRKRQKTKIVVSEFDFLSNKVKDAGNDHVKSKNDHFDEPVSTEEFDEDFGKLFSEEDMPF